MNNSLENLLADARRWIRSVHRHRWMALGTAAAAALVLGLIVQAIPDRYEATARIHVDTQTVLKPLMAGLTYQPDIDQQVAMLAHTLISRSHIESLVRRPEFRTDAATDADREALASRLMQTIQIVPTAAGNVYEIRYRGNTAEDAGNVVRATVDLFVHAGAGTKRQDALEAEHFIESQITAYETKLVEAEDRLKDFKVRNFGVTGVSDQDYFLRISTMTEELGKQRMELAAALQSRDAYRRELSQEDPLLPIEGAARGDSPEGRLDAQKRNLDELLRRYTEEHPDVVIARRTIAGIEGEIRQRSATESNGVRKGARAATSPVYQRLRVALAEAEASAASLQSQVAAGQARLDHARALAGRLPQAEAELAQLNRDYEVIRKNYDQMVARREAASLGERLDETSQLAEFRLIDPTRVSARPVFPSRVQLALAAFVVSIALGVSAARGFDAARPTFDDLRSLRDFTDRPVIGAVSDPAAAATKPVAGALGFAAAAGLLVMLQIAWIVWLFGPQPTA